ncbi:hypothetical protein E4U60_007440 [Claviceps pazoutovae]|uniref:BTB domain-containing protein n=1 Tax=Claviceps pazoutovae TaxID=1649127 RepID=A0A9P7MEN9_9HYPO|nr:hypothetical protein E4U60_007440 [Claviceps pazoutovae]
MEPSFNVSRYFTHASSFMSSKPFEFLVGPEKKVYTIHSGLVARLSPVLDRLVNGDMEEVKKGSVEWKHVDEQTFIRFSQYDYMKIYEYPSFRPEPPADSRSGALRLLEYCYENDTPHAFRDLVVQYIVCRVEYLWLDPAVQDIARAHGDFSAAVVNGLLRRIT